jgi:hypothetical protein
MHSPLAQSDATVHGSPMAAAARAPESGWPAPGVAELQPEAKQTRTSERRRALRIGAPARWRGCAQEALVTLAFTVTVPPPFIGRTRTQYVPPEGGAVSSIFSTAPGRVDLPS